MNATKTEKWLVASVDRHGVKLIRWLGREQERESISWDTLRAAAAQDDHTLSAEYGRLLRDATTMAADGPVEIHVGQDHTNVWWVATVSAVYGGGDANYHRHADEGGTLAHAWMAQREAEDIAKRLGARCAGIYSHDGFGV